MSTYKSQMMKISERKIQINRIGIAIMLGTLVGIGPLCTDLYLPALPEMAGSLGASASLVQLSLTSCLLGLALGQIVIGPYSDVYGRRRPLILSLVVFAIASFLCAFSPSVWILIFLRFIEGVAGAGGIVISRAIARDLYSGVELTSFFSLLMLINGVAPIAAPVAGGQLMKVTSWTGVFFILGTLGTGMLLTVIFGLKESLPKSNRLKGGLKETVSNFGKLLSNRKFMGYVLVQGFIMAGLFGYISGSPFVLQDIYNVSAQTFSLCFAVNGLGIIIAAQMTGKLTKQFGEPRLLRLGLVLSLLGSIALCMMLLFKAELIFILIPLFVVISSIGITMTTSFSLAIQDQEKSAGSASGLLGLIPFIFGALAAPIAGIGGSNTALPMGLVILISNMAALMSYVKLVILRESIN